MNKIALFAISIIFFSSCIPSSIKEEMEDNLQLGIELFADQEFKKAISLIELHKLRNGTYPNELSELQYLTAMDSSLFQRVEYMRMDSVYELNFTYDFPSIDGEVMHVSLHYPPEFWKGLGCVKSNLK